MPSKRPMIKRLKFRIRIKKTLSKLAKLLERKMVPVLRPLLKSYLVSRSVLMNS